MSAARLAVKGSRAVPRRVARLAMLCATVTGHAASLPPFGVVTVAPAFELDGAGSNVDSIAFWEAPDPADTLLLITGKNNDVVEVWQHPFQNNELAPIQFATNVNGIAVDQESDLLYVSDRVVSVLSLPDLAPQGEFGEGFIGVGENNLALLRHAGGQTWIYVSDDHIVHRFDAATHDHLDSFAPPVSSIETVLADDYHQLVLVPEEQGPAGSPGVFAYHPEGMPYERDGTNRFGNEGEFDSDEEGALLYRFPADGATDHGTGFIVVADQRDDVTDFEFFDRQSWAHLGTLRLEGVSNTDGIASTQRAFPGFPLGLFAAVNDDTTTACLGWDAIFAAIGWDLPPDAIASPYQPWSCAAGLTIGLDDGLTNDPDQDRLPNLVEFAIAGDPLDPAPTDPIRRKLVVIDAQRHLAVTLPVREGAAFTGTGPVTATTDGIVYSLAATADLATFDLALLEVTPALDAGLPTLDSGWSYRTFRLAHSMAELPRAFLRTTIAPAAP